MTKDQFNLRALVNEYGDKTSLCCDRRAIKVVPPEVGQLDNLTHIDLHNNDIRDLPLEISQLTALKVLNLGNNKFDVFPSVIGELTHLEELNLGDNRIESLPPEIALLQNLRKLWLNGNNIKEIPPEIGQLSNLTHLYIGANQLNALPREIGNCKHLVKLSLSGNNFEKLPPYIGELENLENLSIRNNKIETLPPEIGVLSKLTALDLSKNHLTELPTQMGKLVRLSKLEIDSNRLIDPPPEIVAQGLNAILGYLQARAVSTERQWTSKLLMVGEGGVGKTELLKALCGETFVEGGDPTHGIDVRQLEIAHPELPDVTMLLSAWDFGGQEIYHATHQFFFSNRSLFVVVWNARTGYEQGKLYYWLDTIRSLAPDAPVLVVATWIDKFTDARLPTVELRDMYPQIIDFCQVSNKTLEGIENFKSLLASTAATNLPLMGEKWPKNWLHAANTIRTLKEMYTSPQQLWEIMGQNDVSKDKQPVLARWLHELGDILFYQNNEELNQFVVIKPQWVTKYISRVLESDEVIRSNGIFTTKYMNKIWEDIPAWTRDHLLQLMECFDLSYRTLENREVSLVVEHLPLDPPDFHEQLEQARQVENCKQITMRFILDTVPAGVPTWFIARSHRFSIHMHWRWGALFADENRSHLALTTVTRRERFLQLTVWGPNPQNFFALLKDGVETTLKVFSGLRVERKIPCPGHSGKHCKHLFDYESLVMRLGKKDTIECTTAMKDVSVTALLYGWEPRTHDKVLSRLDEIEKGVSMIRQEERAEMAQLQTLIQRYFTNDYRREQARIESHCPNVFVIRPHNQKTWSKMLIGEKWDLQLYCQSPGCWHPTEQGGKYMIDKPSEWVSAVAPYLSRLYKILKYAAPLVSPTLGLINDEMQSAIKHDIDLMKELVAKLPELELRDRLTELDNNVEEDLSEPEYARGAALRTLRTFLDEKDPMRTWGGLRKILTPEGHYLWLCETHALQFSPISGEG